MFEEILSADDIALSRKRRLSCDLTKAVRKVRIGWIVEKDAAAVVMRDFPNSLLGVRAGAIYRTTVWDASLVGERDRTPEPP